MITRENIQQRIEELFPLAIEIRRHLHQYPELSFEEYNTSDYIASILDKYHISYEREWVRTGIVATIKGNREGPSIGLRADIDALPVEEKNAHSYRSKNPGVMHACGHDVHTTCLLIAGIILQQNNDFRGNVHLIFQPGEEKLPGGARLMIEQGLLEKFPMQHIIGQHVFPELPAGYVGFREGPYMASSDEIYLTIKGKGGHAALPDKLNDSVVAASAVILALQSIPSRYNPPLIPSVLSFGKIIANGATNIIPDEVRIEGTFRTFDETWRKKAHELITTISRHTAASYGCEAIVDIKIGYPTLINHPNSTAQYTRLAREYLGEDKVVTLKQRMTSEDFAYYTQQIPGCFYRLGTARKDEKEPRKLHSPTFDIDEDAIRTGAGLLAWLAYHH